MSVLVQLESKLKTVFDTYDSYIFSKLNIGLRISKVYVYVFLIWSNKKYATLY